MGSGDASGPSRRDLDKVVELVDRASAAVMRVYRQADLQVLDKDDASPLTQADLAANAIICEGLTHAWPHIPVLTEEAANPFAPGEEPPRYWAVDPLDGTKEFIKRNDEFTVNVALVVDGVPVLGVVAAPALDRTYAGMAGEGARVRAAGAWQPIRVASAGAIPRVAVSRSHPSAELETWLRQLGDYQRIVVGSSLKFCLLAEGRADLYPRFGPTNIWDTAAGHGVLLAAGGRVEQRDGQPLMYRHPASTLNPHFIARG